MEEADNLNEIFKIDTVSLKYGNLVEAYSNFGRYDVTEHKLFDRYVFDYELKRDVFLYVAMEIGLLRSLNYKVGVRRSIWHTFKRIGLEPYMSQIPLNINYSISKRFYYGFK